MHALSEARVLSQWHTGILSFNAALKACDKARRWQQAAAVCSLGVAQALRADVATCSSLVCATGHGISWREAFAWLVHFRSLMLKMNRIVYNSLLTVRPANSLVTWNSAVCILDEFAMVQLRKDAVSFNSIITAYDRCRNWQMALLSFRNCKDRNVETTRVSFGAITSACQRCAKWQIALDVSRQSHRNKAMSNVIHNSVVSACTFAGAWQWALALINDPNFFDQITLNAVLCGPAVQWQRALQRAERMKLPWDLVTHNAALQAQNDSGNWDSSLHLAQEVRLCRLQTSVVTISGLMSVCGQSQQWHTCLTLCGHMVALKLEANIILRNSMMSAGSEWATVLELQRQTEDLGIQLSVVSFGSIMDACDKGRRWSLALALVEILQGRSLEFLGEGRTFPSKGLKS